MRECCLGIPLSAVMDSSRVTISREEMQHVAVYSTLLLDESQILETWQTLQTAVIISCKKLPPNEISLNCEGFLINEASFATSFCRQSLPWLSAEHCPIFYFIILITLMNCSGYWVSYASYSLQHIAVHLSCGYWFGSGIMIRTCLEVVSLEDCHVPRDLIGKK